MNKDGAGGGNTITGLNFEKKVDLLTLLEGIPSYRVEESTQQAGHDIYHGDQMVARCFKKHAFYKFLEENGIDWKSMISKRLLPDDALLVIVRKTLYIIEVKYQKCPGSVDEKLQTCDFKRKQYTKLMRSLNLKVEYVYVLNDWFKHPSYKDVLDYINSVNCHYTFNELPLERLGLPVD